MPPQNDHRTRVIGPTASEDPTLETLDYDLRAACMRVARKVRHEASPVPPHFVTVLAKLSLQPRTAAELAQLELVSAPSMSRTITELEDAGLISREVDPDDRRCQICTLTDAGADVLNEIRETRDSWMADRLASLAPEDRTLLVRAATLLNQMVAR